MNILINYSVIYCVLSFIAVLWYNSRMLKYYYKAFGRGFNRMFKRILIGSIVLQLLAPITLPVIIYVQFKERGFINGD